MKAAIDLDELMRKADWATRGSATSRDLNDARVDPWTLLALIERVRTAEHERDEAIAKLPNWTHAETLQQRNALLAANVAAQGELARLRSERDALRPVVEAVAGASVDQPIGSVKVFAVTSSDGITSRWLPVAAAEALRPSKEGAPCSP